MNEVLYVWYVCYKISSLWDIVVAAFLISLTKQVSQQEMVK
ncbi:hypothetical protein QF028_003467 [Neobacillus sp. B4I6]